MMPGFIQTIREVFHPPPTSKQKSFAIVSRTPIKHRTKAIQQQSHRTLSTNTGNSSRAVQKPKPLPTILSPHGNAYTVFEKLGQGGYGTVYKASCVMQNILQPQEIPQERAIKISRPTQIARLAQTQEEKTTLYLNQSPQNCIVKLFEGFTIGESRYTVYELLQKSLASVIKSSPQGFSLREIRIFAKHLLKILDYLANKDVIHCDIKPSNILVASQNPIQLRLIDFGLASSAYPPAIRMVQTLRYRAPEVAMGLPLTTSADMWSLGCTLVELYTGTPIFPLYSDKIDIDSENRELLLEIAKIVGPIPEEMLKASSFAKDFIFMNHIKAISSSAFSTLFHSQKKQGDQLSQSEADFLDLIKHMLKIDPQERITPERALQHRFVHTFPMAAKI